MPTARRSSRMPRRRRLRRKLGKAGKRGRRAVTPRTIRRTRPTARAQKRQIHSLAKRVRTISRAAKTLRGTGIYYTSEDLLIQPAGSAGTSGPSWYTSSVAYWNLLDENGAGPNGRWARIFDDVPDTVMVRQQRVIDQHGAAGTSNALDIEDSVHADHDNATDNIKIADFVDNAPTLYIDSWSFKCRVFPNDDQKWRLATFVVLQPIRTKAKPLVDLITTHPSISTEVKHNGDINHNLLTNLDYVSLNGIVMINGKRWKVLFKKKLEFRGPINSSHSNTHQYLNQYLAPQPWTFGFTIRPKHLKIQGYWDASTGNRVGAWDSYHKQFPDHQKFFIGVCTDGGATNLIKASISIQCLAKVHAFREL